MNWLHPFWYGFLDFFGVRNEAGPGYGFFSGVCGDLSIFAALFVGLRHLNCHNKHCWRIGRHVTPDGHRLCRVCVAKPLDALTVHKIHPDHQ